MAYTCIVFWVHLLLLCGSHFQYSNAKRSSILAGLSFKFYDSSCPNLKSIVRQKIKKVLDDDISLAAALLRLQYHDCFVQGCDASVLLDGPVSEQTALPNLSLRPEVFVIINELRSSLESSCGRVVSCADLITLAARDAVFLSGGLDYPVPLGRRDGLSFATINDTLASLPSPFSNTSILLATFKNLNLDISDLVALSGAHTIGRAHCPTFTPRLFPTQDPTMDTSFANNLKKICPASNSTNTTMLDIRTPKVFDNKYYVNLVNRQGLFTSDQDLYTDLRTRGIVQLFALFNPMFINKFVDSIIKMGQLSVLTGTQGEIRANCSTTNSNFLLSSVVEGDEAGLMDF